MGRKNKQSDATAATTQSPLRRLLEWSLLSHLRKIDEDTIDESKTSDGRIVSLVLFSGAVLWLLNYIVLDGRFQLKCAHFVVENFGIFGGNPKMLFPEQRALLTRICWSLGCIFFYTAVPLTFYKFVMKGKLSTLGMSPKGFFKHLWIYALLFIPVLACVWIVSYQQSFQHTYPFYRNPLTIYHLLAWEAFYGLQFFALEAFFRGFMLCELKHRWGWRSVLFMIVPYCMIHFTKPGLEALGAIIAGTVLGFLALRTRSIWGGVSIHVAVAWSMDIASLMQRGFKFPE